MVSTATVKQAFNRKTHHFFTANTIKAILTMRTCFNQNLIVHSGKNKRISQKKKKMVRTTQITHVNLNMWHVTQLFDQCEDDRQTLLSIPI